MKSLATINDKDIETIKMALNDSISDINMELKKDLLPNKSQFFKSFMLVFSFRSVISTKRVLDITTITF